MESTIEHVFNAWAVLQIVAWIVLMIYAAVKG